MANCPCFLFRFWKTKGYSALVYISSRAWPVASGRYALPAIGYKGIEYWSPFICYLGLVTTLSRNWHFPFVSCTELDPSSCCVEAFLFSRFRDLIKGRLQKQEHYRNIQHVEDMLWLTLDRSVNDVDYEFFMTAQ